MASLNLFGATTLAPLANTIYDCVVNAGTNPDQNNEVYIYCDTSAGGDITLRLPSLKLYNGIWNTKIYVVDVGNNASGSNITIDAGTFTTTFSSLSGNVATLVTAVPHGISVGETITVAGIGVPYNGVKVVTAVTSTTLSFAQVNAPIPQAPTPTGTVVPAVNSQLFSCATQASTNQVLITQDGANLSFAIMSSRFWQAQGI